MNGLTTHILDLMNGLPAAHVRVDLFYQSMSGERLLIGTSTTNRDGRLDEAFLKNGVLQIGVYEYVFYIGDYFRGNASHLPEPAFLEEVVVRFGVADLNRHYHVPLLVSPWGYQVYRGS